MTISYAMRGPAFAFVNIAGRSDVESGRLFSYHPVVDPANTRFAGTRPGLYPESADSPLK
jgi:hypothetical protein